MFIPFEKIRVLCCHDRVLPLGDLDCMQRRVHRTLWGTDRLRARSHTNDHTSVQATVCSDQLHT